MNLRLVRHAQRSVMMGIRELAAVVTPVVTTVSGAEVTWIASRQVALPADLKAHLMPRNAIVQILMEPVQHAVKRGMRAQVPQTTRASGTSPQLVGEAAVSSANPYQTGVPIPSTLASK